MTRNKITKNMFLDETQSTETASTTESPTVDTKLPSEGYNIVSLPSNGVLGYPKDIEYRDILVKDEEVLSSATVDSYSKTLNGVLKSVVNNPEYYEKLSTHDRDFLLVWIWANNYSDHKDVEIKCGHCGKRSNQRVDLTALPTTDINPNIKIPFEISLKNGNKIFVKLNTVEDEIFAEEYVKNNKKAKFEHVMMVRSIDVGIQIPFEAKMEWIANNVTGKEMGLVRKFHSHFAFGINPQIEHICPECKGVTRGAVPFQTEDILFPTVSADFEKLL